MVDVDEMIIVLQYLSTWQSILQNIFRYNAYLFTAFYANCDTILIGRNSIRTSGKERQDAVYKVNDIFLAAPECISIIYM